MEPKEISRLEKKYLEEYQKLSLEQIEEGLILANKDLKENLILRAKFLMREKLTQTGYYPAPPLSRDVERYSNEEIMTNLKHHWLENKSLEEDLIKIIILRHYLQKKRNQHLHELQKSKEHQQSNEYVEERFKSLLEDIWDLSRKTEYLIRMYSDQDGAEFPIALKTAMEWKTKKEELDAFLKNNPKYARRPELSSVDKYECLEFRLASLALEGWLNHSYLDELKINGQKPTVEELREIKSSIEKFFPLTVFPISKEFRAMFEKNNKNAKPAMESNTISTRPFSM